MELGGEPQTSGEGVFGHLVLILLPGGKVVKNPPANAGDTRDVGLIPGLGRSPGEENGNPLHYSGLENSMDRGACQATVRGVAKTDLQWVTLAAVLRIDCRGPRVTARRSFIHDSLAIF